MLPTWDPVGSAPTRNFVLGVIHSSTEEAPVLSETVCEGYALEIRIFDSPCSCKEEQPAKMSSCSPANPWSLGGGESHPCTLRRNFILRTAQGHPRRNSIFRLASLGLAQRVGWISLSPIDERKICHTKFVWIGSPQHTLRCGHDTNITNYITL
jgi:hypothetical protein